MDAPGAGNTASRVISEVQPLLAVLPEDRSGWRQAFWLYQPHARLGCCRSARPIFAGSIRRLDSAALAHELLRELPPDVPDGGT